MHSGGRVGVIRWSLLDGTISYYIRSIKVDHTYIHTHIHTDITSATSISEFHRSYSTRKEQTTIKRDSRFCKALFF